MDSFDPRLFNENDSYRIFLDGTSKPSRGKFEYAFSRIGCSFLTGGAIGWAIGSYNGIKFLQNEMGSKGLASGLSNLSWKVKRSHMLNHIVKTGTNTANTFGIIAFTYSALNTILSMTTEVDDNFNTLFSATTTGLIYRYASSPKPKPDSTGQLVKQVLSKQARLKRGVTGGFIGLLAGLGIVYFLNDHKIFKTSQSDFRRMFSAD